MPPLRRICLHFQVKMQGFIHFIAKNYLSPETGTGEPEGGLIDPLQRSKDVKRTGVENSSNSHPGYLTLLTYRVLA